MSKAILEINNLILPLKIGLTEQERQSTQEIDFKIKIIFNAPPKACYSDDIDGTICYEKLIHSIEAFCISNQFKLIENLAFRLHHYIQGLVFHNPVELTVSKRPPIDAVKGSCSFTILS